MPQWRPHLCMTESVDAGPALCCPEPAESLAHLHQANVPCAPTVAGHSKIFLDDPHTAANDMIATHQHPVMGSTRVVWYYVWFGTTTVVPGWATPLSDEHTREVLQEVGFTEPAIAELYDKGVVKTEVPMGVGGP